MTRDPNQPSTLGDLLASGSNWADHETRARKHAAPPDPDMVIAALALRHGATFEQLSEELSGNSVSAKIVRDLLNLPAPGERRGRPPQTEKNWSLFVKIETLRRSGLSIGEAVDEVASRIAEDDPEATAPATIRKSYQRARRKWGANATPLSILFGPIPEEVRKDKKKS
jgi:hypothetical protein